jgi:hypothetical protein
MPAAASRPLGVEFLYSWPRWEVEDVGKYVGR